jgi:hypothetical protein
MILVAFLVGFAGQEGDRVAEDLGQRPSGSQPGCSHDRRLAGVDQLPGLEIEDAHHQVGASRRRLSNGSRWDRCSWRNRPFSLSGTRSGCRSPRSRRHVLADLERGRIAEADTLSAKVLALSKLNERTFIATATPAHCRPRSRHW